MTEIERLVAYSGGDADGALIAIAILLAIALAFRAMRRGR